MLLLADPLSVLSSVSAASSKLAGSTRMNGTISFPDPPAKGGGTRFYTSTPTGADDLGYGVGTFNATYNATSCFSRREILLVRGDPSVSPFYGDVVADNYTDIAAVFTHAVEPNTLKNGRGNQVTMTQLKRSYPKWNAHNDGIVQMWNEIIYRGNHNATPLPAQTYKFKMRLPPNMLDVLAGNPSYEAWFENFGIKLDNNAQQTEARLALKTIISAGESGLRFKIAFDLFGKNLEGVDVAYQELWSMRTDQGAAVQGREYDVAIYYKPPISNTDLSGVVQVVIVDLTTDTIVMAREMTGVPMKGYTNGNPRMIMWYGLYTGGFPNTGNIQITYSDAEVWRNNELLAGAPVVVEPISARHILVPPLPGIGHEIYGVLASSQAQDIFRQAWETGGDMQPASAQAARTDTGYPVIESVTETTFASDSVNHAVAMPATVNAGDGLLVFLTIDGDSIPTTPAEWDKLYSEAYSTSVTGCAYALVATGTEGGTTVDFVTGSAEKGAAQVYRISNWNGTLGGFHNGIVAENGSGSTADLPAITAYWESAKTLWIGALHTSTSQTVSSAPTNYTDLTQTSSGAATTDGQCITARRFNETATEDPGVFTMSGTGAAKVYNTVAIAPAYVGPNYERFEVTRDGTTLWQGLYTTQDHTVADSDITRAVIVVHGRSLDAAEYHNVVAHNMRDYLGNTIVLAPFYERNVERADVDQLFWGSSWPQLGRSSSLLPWRISSGEIMDLLVAHLYNTFENLEGVVIAGHSAGGQFCNRYSMASTDSRNRFIVSAPSSYAYPGVHRPDGNGGFRVPSSPSTYNDWKYGLDNLSSVSYANAIGASNLRRRFIYAKVHYMVGALDTDPAASSLDVTDAAMVQGTQRVERQSYFYDYIRLVSVWR